MEKWLKSTTSLRIISIIAAILVWLYVILVLDPEITVEIDGIPVSYLNYAQFEKKDMHFVGENEDNVNVKVTGKRSVIAKVSTQSFNAVVDLNGVDWPATHQLPIKVATPDGTIIKDIIPSQSTVTLDKYSSITLPINVIVKGIPKEGYFVQSKTVSPDFVTITAPSSIIEKAFKLNAEIDVSNADNDVSTPTDIKILDKNGNELSNKDVIKVTDKALITCTMYKQKEFNIQVAINGTVNDKYTLKTEVQPSTIILNCPVKYINSINQINTKPIDVSGLKESKDTTLDLIIPDGFILANDHSSKAKVKLIIERK